MKPPVSRAAIPMRVSFFSVTVWLWSCEPCIELP
jgi:hypothetical protein